MNSPDYFFLFFLGTIAFTRLLVSAKLKGPTIGGFRVRHYMEGIAIIILAFLMKDLTFFAIGLGLVVDELPVILRKGPGYKDEHWRGCEDYHEPWSVAGVFVLVLLVFIFRSAISGII